MTVAASAGTGVAEPKPVFVYVIGHDGNNVVKIGKADDVPSRFGGIQRMSPVKLSVLVQFEGGYKLETALHRRFKHLRTHGEWFDFGDDDAVVEITRAVEDIEALWAKRETEKTECRRQNAERRSGQPRSVYRIGDELRVSSGGDVVYCVGRTARGKRCKNVAAEADLSSGHFDRYVIPGIGTVILDNVSTFKPDAPDRVMRQLCISHYPGIGVEAETVAETEWLPFDLIEHAEVVRFGVADLDPRDSCTFPGMGEIQRKVNEYAAKQAFDYALTLLPAELAAALTARTKDYDWPAELLRRPRNFMDAYMEAVDAA